MKLLQLTPARRKSLIDSALGRKPFDLVITNIQLVNVFSGEIYPAQIGITDGYISFIDDTCKQDLKSDKMLNGDGKFAVPGFIDSHVHIESSMLTPPNFAQIVVPKGTTTVVTDPHEIANVLGLDGVRYMLESAQGLPMYQFALAPSCVPAVPGKETSGAEFNRDEIEELLNMDGVLGVAEIMDYKGVLDHTERMSDILELAIQKDVFIQGHFFGDDPRQLAAYICGGPTSNHEFMGGTETLTAIRFGMTVDARDSSFARNIQSIVSSLGSTRNPANLTLCTDDRHPEAIQRSGHIDDCLRSAVAAGLDPVEAVRAATINIARIYRLDRRLGGIAPGFCANINIIDDLKNFTVRKVLFEGKMVSSDGVLVSGTKPEPTVFVQQIEARNTVILPDEITESDLKIAAPVQSGTVKVVVVTHNNEETSLTHQEIEAVDIVDGYVDISSRPDLNFVAIINRHGHQERKTLGLISNFHLDSGAVAGTVSHDSHNLAVVYTNPSDAKKAIDEIKRIGGGTVYSEDGRIESLPLPVGGLMSEVTAEEFIPQAERMNEVLAAAGIRCEDPVMRIATIALPVIPSIKITDLGLVNTDTQEFVSLFV